MNGFREESKTLVWEKNHETVLIQPSTAAIELVGVVPVEKRNIRGNASRQKFINQLVLEF